MTYGVTRDHSASCVTFQNEQKLAPGRLVSGVEALHYLSASRSTATAANDANNKTTYSVRTRVLLKEVKSPPYREVYQRRGSDVEIHKGQKLYTHLTAQTKTLHREKQNFR